MLARSFISDRNCLRARNIFEKPVMVIQPPFFLINEPPGVCQCCGVIYKCLKKSLFGLGNVIIYKKNYQDGFILKQKGFG